MGYVVDYHSAIRVTIVHWRKGFIPLLPRRIPDFEFHGRLLVEGDGLGEEGGADGGFSVVVELVLWLSLCLACCTCVLTLSAACAGLDCGCVERIGWQDEGGIG